MSEEQKGYTRRELLSIMGKSAFTLAGATGFLAGQWPSAEAGQQNGANRTGRGSLAAQAQAMERAADFANPLRLPSEEGILGVFEPAGPFAITAKPMEAEVIKGYPTTLWVYHIEEGGRSYINPVIKVRKGSNFTAVFNNLLPQRTIIHWHGLALDSKNDSHPLYEVAPGGQYLYNFDVLNRAATCFFHPHAHGATAEQVYRGLAGFFLIEDDEDDRFRAALGLELGKTDIPLLIQDRTFDQAGNMVYTLNGMSAFDGFYGNEVLVNLTQRPYLDVETRVYRFRLVNGSNARVYQIAFIKDGKAVPFYLTGNDGGLLDRPYLLEDSFLAPGERLDLCLDLRSFAPGDVLTLSSLDFSAMSTGMGGPMMGGHGLQEGISRAGAIPLMQIRVKAKVEQVIQNSPYPLSTIQAVDTNGANTRAFELSFFAMQWTVNGITYDEKSIPVAVQRGAREIWVITNTGYGHGMYHPMHLHGFSFQVLERRNSPSQVQKRALDARGLAPSDLGIKDTVLIWPGETVRIAVNFSCPFLGDQLYLFHCHILEHSDRGMMINYSVV